MKTIAWIPGQLANPSQAFAWKMIQKHAADNCFDVIVLDGKGDVQEQVKAINNAVAQKVDVIFVNPNDAKAIVPSLTEARKAGVVVGWFMSNPAEDAKESADFFVGVDDNQAGEFAAKAILDSFPDGATMVEIGGQAGHDAAIRRHDGFAGGIEGTKINVLEYKNPQQWDTAQAQAIAEDMITKYGDEIQAIFCHWDNGATGVINALKAKSGMENVMIVAVDGNKTGFDQVQSWPNYISIAQNIETITTYSMKTANLFLNKDTSAKYENIVPFDIITKDSIGDFTPPEW
ncbi:MAG: sugar ABC transporter substrate-binding protein [Leptolinea sp.]|nr:sugar ABC transporter substrate-binding protein [Leptolinea sp.]